LSFRFLDFLQVTSDSNIAGDSSTLSVATVSISDNSLAGGSSTASAASESNALL
jgi:hypothetical protein